MSSWELSRGARGSSAALAATVTVTVTVAGAGAGERAGVGDRADTGDRVADDFTPILAAVARRLGYISVT